ncbi:undecaprenyl-diphosphate phosphatase [Aerococcaceae bacterium INB8]|uniref:Undecaprenyl-diphosphatase n=1 Tax=Ruoffia halotolerans TaxID=2748684 RepID=A0A839A6G2_9LACT|nr:undecaprenyl-diphosphate phosphatase [Ruoffia halotolerans]MBA5729424.1 undecaprenyl-diphosphate phosphatase [Ruoffia halotolerans]
MDQMIDIIELIKIFVLSVVQGITEWLPISSTGHMIILEDLIPLNLSSEFVEVFLVLVQLGSIFAVILLYFNKLNPFSPKKTSVERKDTWVLWFKVAFASIPVAIFGFALKDYMDEYFYNPIVVAIALIVYGIIFIWIERTGESKHAATVTDFNSLSFTTAFKIGIFQALSIIPGTSRSGSTIIGGLLVGTSRYIATEFSFFLSIPAMFGASLVKLLDLGFAFTTVEWIYLLFGMFIAFIVSVFAIKFLLNYLKRNDFTGFGKYRIVLGAIVILYSLFQF